MSGEHLLWFRDDLRLSDNDALAALAGLDVTAVYVVESVARPLGAASRWWLRQSLSALAEDLAELGIPLHVRAGDPREIIPAFRPRTLAFHRRYHQPLQRIDDSLTAALSAAGTRVHAVAGFLLGEPDEVLTNDGTPYRVFTPFSRRLAEHVDPAPAAGRVRARGAGARLANTRAEIAEHLPSASWSEKLAGQWEPGEQGAHAALQAFDPAGYDRGRDLPALAATSRLSPHLRFGEVSVRRVWQDVDHPGFRRQLMWRDFAWHRLAHRPDLATVNVRDEFSRFPWRWPGDPGAEEDLRAWQRGRTGIALVDAGMRELWETGHQHNRVRMVTASFLTKNLRLHWRLGEQWFWDSLVDADAASNPFNWQWVAGCGDDAAPYFRIFNPDTQAQRFDRDERYRRRYVPEFFDGAPPPPIVDLKESRAEALAAYDLIKRA